MDKKLIKRNLILGILFFLPVIFLLFLYPAQHNYDALDVVHSNVKDLAAFSSDSDEKIQLKDHITVLGFLGKHPMQNSIAASNLKELVYDKFKGFKKFQIVIVLPEGSEAEVELLKKEINSYEELTYWHFVYGNEQNIDELYKSLLSDSTLDVLNSSNNVYIIDKDLEQRGRNDDRTDKEHEKNSSSYPLLSYDCIEVAIIKNKMSDDLRVLFTEYRQKRKGDFNSESRRADDLKGNKDE